MTTATLDDALPDAPAHDARRWWVLFVILSVEVMDLLDGTIVNVAAPAIRGDLGASLSALQWVTGGYALAFAVGLVTGGRLGDLLGRRRMFLIGVAGFTIASALCGLAPNADALIGFRLVQGLFAASMIPQGFGIVRQVFPPAEVGKAFSLFGPVIGGSAILGPVIGGLLVDADLLGTGWRMIFYVNVPLGILAFVAGARLIPDSPQNKQMSMDVIGAVLASAAAALLIYPLIQGLEAGWPAWTFAMMASSIATLVVFVVVERRRGAQALVPMQLFRPRAFSAGLVIVLAFFGGMVGLMFTFSVYLQIGNGYSAVKTGLAFIPWAFGVAVGAVTGGVLTKLGRHRLHLGLGLMALGVLGMLAVVHGTTGQVSIPWLLGPEGLAGVGMGMVISPLFMQILGGVPDDDVGSGSGVLNAVQQLGGAAGIAILGTQFLSVARARGFGAAFERCLELDLAFLAVCAVLVLVLPLQARDEGA